MLKAEDVERMKAKIVSIYDEAFKKSIQFDRFMNYWNREWGSNPVRWNLFKIENFNHTNNTVEGK